METEAGANFGSDDSVWQAMPEFEFDRAHQAGFSGHHASALIPGRDELVPMRLTIDEAIDKSKEFLGKAGFTYFLLQSVEPLEREHRWKVVTTAVLFGQPKELIIDDDTGKIISFRNNPVG